MMVLLSKKIVGMIWGGLDQIMGGKKVKNCDVFIVSTPRKSSNVVGLLGIIGILKNYKNICNGRYRSPVMRKILSS